MNIYNHTGRKLNAFSIVNGVPTLLGEYIDQVKLQQIDDPSLVKNYINVTNLAADRTIVDIVIDNINNIKSNEIKYKYLLKLISEQALALNGALDVVKSDVLIKINYQIENAFSGVIVKRGSEQIRIGKRTYYTEGGPVEDILKNNVITNLYDQSTLTISAHAHGSRGMVLRLLDIEIFYPTLSKKGSMLGIGPHRGMIDNGFLQNKYEVMHPCIDYDAGHNLSDRFDDYHDPFNYDPCIPGGRMYGKHCHCPPAISPHNHSNGMSPYYYFNKDFSDIILNFDEIDNSNSVPNMIKIASIPFNRVVTNVVYGSKIVFKIGLWDNDIIFVKNTSDIARLLGVGNNKGVIDRLNDIDNKILDMEKADTIRDLQFHELADKVETDLVHIDFADKVGGYVTANTNLNTVTTMKVKYKQNLVNISDGSLIPQEFLIESDGNIIFLPVTNSENEIIGFKVTIDRDKVLLRSDFESMFTKGIETHKLMLEEKFQTMFDDAIKKYTDEHPNP